MTRYLYETHLHTSEASACGKVSGGDYIDYMIDKGYQGIIVTDHFFNGNSPVPASLPWKERVDWYVSGYRKTLKSAEGRDFDVLFGIEYNFDGDEYLLYGLDIDWLYENEDILSLSRREVYNRVHESGGIMVAAHPYRERYYLTKIVLTPDICDAIEIYNAANPDNQNALGYQYAKKLKLPMTAGSDIHFFNDNAMGGMLLPYRIKNTREYADALMHGKATPVRVYDGKIENVEDVPELVNVKDQPSLEVVMG